MLDILSSPLRGYIAQTLQFYLSKYIEGIQLEGLGLFGGDLVLNDLEIKRHVLVESLEIPSSFDFSRGFIRELRIHIPWTQLLSQPIEVKLYTIELILTARDESKESFGRRGSRTMDSTTLRDAPAPEMETPKAGWLRETLHKILTNITLQINNLVLKYEQDDMVLSIALGTLDCYAVNDKKNWLRGFTEPRGPSQDIARSIDMRDLTIFLDRYTSDRKTSDSHQRGTIHRRVVGYELPVLSRSTISIRARMCLKPGADQNEVNVANAIHRKNSTFANGPSAACDPFYHYSCTRSSVIPTTEIDVFVSELSFSLSDRQLEMLGELLNRTLRRLPTRDVAVDEATSEMITKPDVMASLQNDQLEGPANSVSASVSEDITANATVAKQADTKKRSWMAWAMEALGGPQDDEDDELIAEILAETKEALRRSNTSQKLAGSTPSGVQLVDSSITSSEQSHRSQQFARVLCCRTCINSATLTLRKHENEELSGGNDIESEELHADEELVPVANIGLVKVSNRPSAKVKQSKPATEVCSLSLTYSAMEVIISRDEDQDLTDVLTDVVIEVERVKLVYARNSTFRDTTKTIISWGSIFDSELRHTSSSSQIGECVSHPYFNTTFFGEAARSLGRQDSRSFELVKVSQDMEIPVWKTVDRRKSSHAPTNAPDPTLACTCSITVHGGQVQCVPIPQLLDVSKTAVESIGIQDRHLDHVGVLAALEAAWVKHCHNYVFDQVDMTDDIREVCKTYRAMRDPDSPATKNLNQFLLPSLFRLLARRSLHSCFLVNPNDVSKTGYVDLRARTVHSALRFRYVALRSSTTSATTKSEDKMYQHNPSEKGTVRTRSHVDASLGPLELNFDPVEISDIIALLYAIRKNEECVPENGTATKEPNSPTELGFVDHQSCHLVTLHSASAKTKCRSNGSTPSLLHVTSRDFSWFASKSSAEAGGGWTRKLHLGRGSANFSPSASSYENQTDGSSMLIDLLDCAWVSSGGDGAKTETKNTFRVGKASAELDWVQISFSIAAIDDVLRSFRPRKLGFEVQELTMPRQRSFARVEICHWCIHNATKMPREGSADRVWELHCGSCAVTVSRNKHGVRKVVLEAGCVPFTHTTDMEPVKPMLQVKYQESRSRQHSYVDAWSHIAMIRSSVHDLEYCVVDAFIFLQHFQSRRSTRALTAPRTPASENKAKYWHFVARIICDGAVIALTPALEVLISQVEIASDPTLHSNRREAIEPGGSVKLGFNCSDLRVVNRWKAVSERSNDDDSHVVGQICGLTGSMLYSQDIVSSVGREVVDISVQVRGLKFVLDRVSLRHLTRVVCFVSTLGRTLESAGSRSVDSEERVKPERHRSIRIGCQVECAELCAESNVEKTSSQSTQTIFVSTRFRAQDVAIASRKASYRPKTDFTEGCDQVFTDLQLSIGSVQAQEDHKSWGWADTTQCVSGRFGTLCRLSERDFLGVLLCLDGRDLPQVASALKFDSSAPTSVDKKSLIASWHSVNLLAQSFRDWSTTAPDFSGKLVFRSICCLPILSTANSTPSTSSNQPLFAAFYRDYGEAQNSPRMTFAASLEDVDLVIMPTTVASLASLFDFDVVSISSSRPGYEDHLKSGSSESQPKLRELSPPKRHPRSAGDQLVSVITGKVRVLFPDSRWIEWVGGVERAQSRILPPPCVSFLLDHTTISSTMWQEISLDGLGYPPFNSALLPRRVSRPHQLRRITSDTPLDRNLRRCLSRLGNISGAMVEWLVSESANLTKESPLDIQLSRTFGTRLVSCDSEAFLRPFSFSLELICDSGTATSINIAITKVRAEVSKSMFDQIMLRARDLIVSATPVGISVRNISSKTDDPKTNTQPRRVEIGCDGVEIVAAQETSSIHLRVGSVLVQQSTEDGESVSGDFSVQNIVAALRYGQEVGITTSEELVFGPNSDPCSWQLDVNNVPLKLISGRWTTTVDDDACAESSVFVDVHGLQAHLSSHILDEVSAYVHLKGHDAFVIRRYSVSVSSILREAPLSGQSFHLSRSRTVGVKLLLGPSVSSFWVRDPVSHLVGALWMEIDQMFASIENGNGTKSHHIVDQQPIRDLDRLVVVPGIGLAATIDKVLVRTSASYTPLILRFKTDTLTAIPGQVQSSWAAFARILSQSSARTTLLQESTIRFTGSYSVVAERINGSTLVATPLTVSSFQIDPSSLSFKISAASLASLNGFVEGLRKSRRRDLKEPSPSNDTSGRVGLQPRYTVSSEDDLATLRHRIEQSTSSLPTPGDVVFSETLLVETATGSAPELRTGDLDLIVDYEPSRVGQHVDGEDEGSHAYDETAEVLRWIELVNEPWSVVDEVEGIDEVLASPLSLPDAQTISWMSLKWCYHLPRRITEIAMDPVPVPPTGVPADWPVWCWTKDPDSSDDDHFIRICDIVCQLRVWDSVRRCYVIVAEFLVPWEASNGDRVTSETLETKGGFGDLMSVFFDGAKEDEDRTKFSRVLEVTCCRRIVKMRDLQASDKWELRWRSPLSGEQDKHQRVHISALLAASLNVRSQLVESAVQRVNIQCSVPVVSIAAAYVQGNDDASHDLVSADLNDTQLTLVDYAGEGGLKILFKSELQIVFDNLAQLLTVPIVPRVELHGLIDRNVHTGTEISVALGDARVYLPQSAILLLANLTDMLKSSNTRTSSVSTAMASSLPVLRVQLVNACGRDIWFRQCGTRESLHLRSGERDAYSWLTLEGDPSYDCLQFALGDQEHSVSKSFDWCDPCRVREQAVTGRYFHNFGFLWIAVERCRTVTTVYLRGALNIVNCLPEPVLLKVQSGSHSPIDANCRYTNDPSQALRCLQQQDSPSSRTVHGDFERVGVMIEGVGASLRLGDEASHSQPSRQSAPSNVIINTHDLPAEFDPYNVTSDGTHNRCRVSLQLQRIRQSNDEKSDPHHVIVEVVRAAQLSTMPNDFICERSVLRHTWMDVYVFPSIQLVNCCDAALYVGLYDQGDQPVEVPIEAHGTAYCTSINPGAVRAVTLQSSSGKVSATCSVIAEASPRSFQLGPLSCELVPPSPKNPLYQIVLRRRMVVINRSSSAVMAKLRLVVDETTTEPIKPRLCTLRLDPEKEMSPTLELDSYDQAPIISVGVSLSLQLNGIRNGELGDVDSSEVVLILKAGSMAVVRCPVGRSRGLDGELHDWEFFHPFVVSIDVSRSGSVKMLISALVTVHNDTGLRLRFRPSLLSTSSEEVVECGNAWEAPIRQRQDFDKSRGGSGVTSWISSAFGYGAKTRASSFAFGSNNTGRTVCSFQVSICSGDGVGGVYSWTEEVAVRVPDASVMDKPSNSALPTSAYPLPSSVSARHRRLVRHSAMRHAMLTITISQLDDSTIHVLIFIDRQTPVAIENTWSYPVGVRVMSSQVMTPDAIAGQHYVEYDWLVQRRPPNKSKAQEGSISLDMWLEESSKAFDVDQFDSDTTSASKRFQLGLPGFGWSNVLWQVPGIQFARFTSSTTMHSPVFLVAITYRAGTWFISVSCLDDPSSQPSLPAHSQQLISQSAAREKVTPVSLANRFRLVVSTELVQIHCCDEHTVVASKRAGTNAVVYKEVFRVTLRAPCISFISTSEAPAALQTEARLGYMKHIRSYNVLFAGLGKLEIEHSFESCNFPVMLSAKHTTSNHADFTISSFHDDVIAAHDKHWKLLSDLMAVEVPDMNSRFLSLRIINVTPYERAKIPSYYQSVQVRLAPTVIQVDDEIMAHLQSFIRPITEAFSGTQHRHSQSDDEMRWRLASLNRIRVTSQQRVFIDELDVGNLEVTVTARISIPVLSSLDNTPLVFGARKMRRVFNYSDQLIKDLAAEYFADVLVRSPLLIMSLNIIGNPAGFLRSVGTGIRDLFEIPITVASRDGFNPWVLTRGVCGGIASLVGRTSAAALSSLSGFTYSISRTVDHLTLTSEQLRRRHYIRPTHLTSGIAGGLGSLGSSVVGAATGVISTPIALYREKRERGLHAGVSDVVGGLGMGLVGIVARPMGGVASLLAMTSDGILNSTGMGEQMSDEDDSTLFGRATFEARPNDALRAKLKILCDPSVGDLVLAHGACVNPSEALLSIPVQGLRQLTPNEMEDNRVSDLFSDADRALATIVVSVICTRTTMYIVGIGSSDESQRHEIVSKAELVDIHTIEESLREPARLDIGVRSRHDTAWYHLRLVPAQRRQLSHSLRKWHEEVHGRGFATSL